MSGLAKLLALAVGLGILGMLAFGLLFERVGPDKIGVKIRQWGSGVFERDHEPGFHLGVTGYHRWRFFDRQTHFLTFSETDAIEDAGQRPNLDIRTKDNNQAYVDVTITYRIKPGEAYLIAKEGMANLYRERAASTVESVLREELAQLSSEEFYDTELRTERARATLPTLDKAMAQYHVEPLDLLIRAVRFPDQYEKKLQEKQLTTQRGLLAGARERVEKQEQVTGVIDKETEAQEKQARADWDKRLQDARSDNEILVARILGEARVYDQRTRSDADADYVTAIADGSLALAKAEALRNELRNAALDTRGGRILLASQAAENLRIGEVTLNSNDPDVPSILDVDELVRILMGAP